LAYGPRTPKLAKTFDRSGNVLLCGSLSKVLAPGFRIGWIHAGRYQAELERLKFINSVAAASLPQLVAAEYLESGGFDRYLVRLRIAFAEQVRMVSQAVAKYFPEGTRITRPGAGYLLWVEMPKKIDALKLFRMALDANIGIVPGPIFSTTGRFGNCIRLSCGYRWSDTIDRALVTLGRACDEIGRQG
jgi:DNA-binding transcriptional MocR family regulator